MPSGIEEDVGESRSNFARRLQDAEVVTAIQNGPSAAKHAIDGPRKPRPDRLHPPPERLLPRRLHDQVHVIPLHRVVHDPELPPLTPLSQGPPQLLHEPLAAKHRHIGPHTQGHVRRMIPPHRRPSQVLHARPRSRRPPRSRPRAPTTGALPNIVEGELGDARRHPIDIGYVLTRVNPAATKRRRNPNPGTGTEGGTGELKPPARPTPSMPSATRYGAASSVAFCHSATAAYARQGRQRSERRSSSRALGSRPRRAAPRRRPRSLAGKASGSRSARIPT